MSNDHDLRQMIGEVQSRVTTVDTRALGTPRFDQEGRRIYRALAYDTSNLDRHGTTMTPDAIKLTGPVPVLLFHNRDSFPVAKVIEWNITDRGPEAGFVFADTDEAATAEALVATGFLRGVSVGFIANEGYVREDDGAIVFTDAELVELSLTPTPSSRGALVDLKRSIDDLMAAHTMPLDGPVSDADGLDDIAAPNDTRDADDTAETVPADDATEERDATVLDADTDERDTAATDEQAATVESETARRVRTISRINRLG